MALLFRGEFYPTLGALTVRWFSCGTRPVKTRRLGLPDLPIHFKSSFTAPVRDPNVASPSKPFQNAYKFSHSAAAGGCTSTLSPSPRTVSFTKAVGPAGPFNGLVVEPQLHWVRRIYRQPVGAELSVWVLSPEEWPPRRET